MINKDEIAIRVAFLLETVNKKTVSNVIDTLFFIMTDALQKGEDVKFTKLGTFSTKMRKGRQGFNPQNPEEKIEIPEVRVVKFKPSHNLKKIIKNR